MEKSPAIMNIINLLNWRISTFHHTLPPPLPKSASLLLYELGSNIYAFQKIKKKVPHLGNFWCYATRTSLILLLNYNRKHENVDNFVCYYFRMEFLLHLNFRKKWKFPPKKKIIREIQLPISFYGKFAIVKFMPSSYYNYPFFLASVNRRP